MNTKRRANQLKLLAIGCIATVSLITSSCEKLKNLEPKSFADKFEGKIAGEWTVDSIKYSSFDVSKHQISEQIMPVGKITFMKTDDSHGDDLRAAQGYMYHSYLKNGITITDTTAYSYDVNNGSDLEVKYFKIHNRGTDRTFISSPTVIFDIKEVSKSLFKIERFERLVDMTNGQEKGFLRSVFKMHR
ncbi:MAG: hypothetical protein H7096_06525 [Flavobacterium sp.]|nr:hypothetical protein [Pedobacter sp.]